MDLMKVSILNELQETYSRDPSIHLYSPCPARSLMPVLQLLVPLKTRTVHSELLDDVVYGPSAVIKASV